MSRKIITALLALAWMFLIGSFSAQQGTESAGLSQRVTETLVSVQNKLFQKNWSQEEMEQRVEQLEFYVRKLAHMSEYAVLAVLLLLHVSCYGRKVSGSLFLAWLLATLYASADEIHQLFVPGRSGQFRDVCIDSAGALLGMLAAAFCIWMSSANNVRMKE